MTNSIDKERTNEREKKEKKHNIRFTSSRADQFDFSRVQLIDIMAAADDESPLVRDIWISDARMYISNEDSMSHPNFLGFDSKYWQRFIENRYDEILVLFFSFSANGAWDVYDIIGFILVKLCERWWNYDGNNTGRSISIEFKFRSSTWWVNSIRFYLKLMKIFSVPSVCSNFQQQQPPQQPQMNLYCSVRRFNMFVVFI